MSLIDIRPWTNEAFFAWQQSQDERYELVGGFPARMMTGASRRHDRIVVNVMTGLQNRLAGTGCEAFTADGAIETFPGQIRRPDVGVDCGNTDPDAYLASDPTVVFEVLSPSTRDFDRLRKLEEYKSVDTMRHIVIVEPRRVGVLHFYRADANAAWSIQTLNASSDMLVLTAVGIELPVAEIYARIIDLEPA